MIANQDVIRKAVDYIKGKVDPERVYLFGSYAKGNPTPDSDLDFLIIKRTSLPSYKRTIPLYSTDKTKKIGIAIGMDFIVYTPTEFEVKKSEINSIAGEVLRTGKLLYEKK